MAKVIWADPAIEDLDAIADYIALDRPDAAQRLVQQVLAAVQMLQKFPQMARQPTELRGLPYRQLVVSPCRIFYRIEKKTVYIVHVLRGEQQVRRESFAGEARVPRSTKKLGAGRHSRRGGGVGPGLAWSGFSPLPARLSRTLRDL